MTDINGKYSKEEIAFSVETIERVYNMDEKLSALYPILMVEIPKMQMLLSTIANAQSSMALAAASMANTNEKAELRFEKMEGRLQAANDKAAGKGQIPIISHYLILGSSVLIAVLVILYVNRQTLNATLTSIKIDNEKTHELIKEDIQERKDEDTGKKEAKK